MKQLVDSVFVLRRQDFGEADRIVVCLTKNNGIVTVIAKGVRKSKSKLAGGIELLAENAIVFVPGRGEMATLISSRMTAHYTKILTDITRLQWLYTVLADIARLTTHEEDTSFYYYLLSYTYQTLDKSEYPLWLVQSWLYSQILSHSGHALNLQTDVDGESLTENKKYTFILEQGSFFSSVNDGAYTDEHIKLLRLITTLKPEALRRIRVDESIWSDLARLLENMCRYHNHMVR